MTIRISDGTADFLQTKGCFKEAMHDFCIDIFSGAQPASPNLAPGALKLMRFTKDGEAWSRSITQKNSFTITDATESNTQVATLNGVVYTYVNGASETTATIASAIADLLNSSKMVHAASLGEVVIVYDKYPGVGFTLTAGGTGSPSTAEITANVRGTGLQFGVLTGNVLSKDSSNWIGIGIADGVAGWWRMKGSFSDDDSTNASFIRLDGACNTANSDLLALTTLNIVVGGTDNITAFTVTQPQS